MINILVTALICFVISVMISGAVLGMGSNSGWAAAGKEAAEACLLIVIAFVIFSAVYSTGVGYEGIPFANCIENYTSLKDLMVRDPASFVFNAMQLFTVTLLMSLLAKVVPSSIGGRGVVGSVLSKILLVVLALVANHYVVAWAKGSMIWSLVVNYLTYFFGLSVVVLTPAMIITQLITAITGLSAAAPFVVFLARTLPNSALGKAIQTSFTTAMTFLGVLFVTDAYFGTLRGAAVPIVQILTQAGPIVIMLGGLLLMISAVFH